MERGIFMCIIIIAGFVFALWLGIATASAPVDFVECKHWNDSFYHDGFCYKIINLQKTWNEAKDWCASDHPSRRLAEFDSTEAAKYLMRKAIMANNGFLQSYDNIWVGGHFNVERNVLEWTTTKTRIAMSLEVWFDEKKNFAEGKECLGLISPHRRLSFQSCDDDSLFICQEYVGNPCPHFNQTSRYLDGYCFSRHTNKKRTLEEGMRFCKSHKVKLAEPTTPRLLDFVLQEIFYAFDLYRIALPPRTTTNAQKYDRIMMNKIVRFAIKTCGSFKVIAHEFGTRYRNYVGVFIIEMHSNLTHNVVRCYKHIITNQTISCQKPASETMMGDGTKDLENACHRFQSIGIVYHDRRQTYSVTFFERFHYKFSTRDWINPNSYSDATFVMGDGPPTEIVYSGSRGTVARFSFGAVKVKDKNMYVWMSTGEPVNLPRWYWKEGHPNIKEHNKYMATNSILGDLFSVGNYKIRPICQWDVLLHSHVVLVNEDESPRTLQVTTDSVTIVPVLAKLLDKSGNQTSIDDLTAGVSHVHPIVADISLGSLPSLSGEPGVFLLIQSTKKVTVVIHSRHPETQAISSVLIYSTNILSDQYIVYPYESGELRFFKTEFIALDDGETRVRLMSDQGSEEHTLEQFQSNSSSLGPGKNSGMLISADKRIAVFTNSQFEGSEEFSVFQHLPVDTLSDTYVTFALLPVQSTPVTSFRYTLVAAYANTVIETNKRPDHVLTLWNEGDAGHVDLPSNDFHRVKGDKPFYLSLSATTGSNPPTCFPTPIIPSNLWQTVVTIHVTWPIDFPDQHIAVIFKNQETGHPVLRATMLNGHEEKSQIKDIGDYRTAIFSLNSKERKKTSYNFNLRLTSGDGLVAYLVSTSEKGGLLKYPTGVSDRPFNQSEKNETTLDFGSFRQNLQQPSRASGSGVYWVKKYPETQYINEAKTTLFSDIPSAIYCALMCEDKPEECSSVNYSETKRHCVLLKDAVSVSVEEIKTQKEWDIWERQTL